MQGKGHPSVIARPGATVPPPQRRFSSDGCCGMAGAQIKASALGPPPRPGDSVPGGGDCGAWPGRWQITGARRGPEWARAPGAVVQSQVDPSREKGHILPRDTSAAIAHLTLHHRPAC